MADDVEVEITIPDEETGIDANSNGIPDGIEIGKASEQAKNATETAEEAIETAEEAQQSADNAAVVSYATSESVNELQILIGTMAANMAAQNDQIAKLTALAEANATAATAQMELQLHNNQPSDEPPKSTHWLTRKIGAR